ncbi:MAG: peptidylprolyl isomerase [Gammaproteobacteria bacterium]|jgi:peptidyl-prolyl cis-trans isomerase C|nr:peptidylprolyl isomerase [Gammaproteobacteria bacterium]
MTFSIRAGATRATRLAVIAGAVAITASGTLWAQADAGVSIDPAVFNMYLESRIQKPAGQATAEEMALVRDELTDIYLLSEEPSAEALKKDPRIQAQIELQTRAMLAQAVAADFVSSNPATDEEMRALYDEQIKLAPPMEFKARHILVETQGEAQALVTELEGGADFAELASAKSTGPSASSGGDLGWFPPDRMVAEFSTAVQAMGNGEFTKAPVQTQFGWHVILREDSRESAPPPYDSVVDVLKQEVEGQKLRDYMSNLRKITPE